MSTIPSAPISPLERRAAERREKREKRTYSLSIHAINALKTLAAHYRLSLASTLEGCLEAEYQRFLESRTKEN